MSEGYLCFTIVFFIFVGSIALYNIANSYNGRREYEAKIRYHTAELEYKKAMNIMPDEEPKEEEEARVPGKYEVLTCPACEGECSVPNFNNTETEDCRRCDCSGELRWDYFTDEEKAAYLNS